MSNDVSLSVSSPPALYDEDHAMGDIVVVTRRGRSYYGRVLSKMTNGGYLVDPIAFDAPTPGTASSPELLSASSRLAQRDVADVRFAHPRRPETDSA